MAEGDKIVFITYPTDWENPNWDEYEKVHGWKNYISAQIRELWHTFSPIQKQAIASNAQTIAEREEWD